MPRPRNQRQMETLSDYLAMPRPRAGTRTQGNIIPVTRPRNPYIRVNPENEGVSTSLAAQLGATRAEDRARTQAPSLSPQVSYEADPILARIKALNTKDIGSARAEADSLKRQAFIDYGFSDVAGELGADANTIAAAQANPFSVRERLTRDTAERGRQLNENMNQSNLFYSGARVNSLEELARNQAEAQVGANRDLRDLLGQVDAGLLGIEEEAAMREEGALQDAAEAARAESFNQALLDALAGDPSSLAAPEPFISPELGAMAGVDPYYYDPYEEDLALALAMNPIYGRMGAF